MQVRTESRIIIWETQISERYNEKACLLSLKTHETIGHEYQILRYGQGGISPVPPKNISPARRGKKRRVHQCRKKPPHHFSHPNPPPLYIMVVTTIYVTRHGVSPSLTLPGTPLSISGPHTLPPLNSSGAIGPSIRKRAPTQLPLPVLPVYHQTLP